MLSPTRLIIGLLLLYLIPFSLGPYSDRFLNLIGISSDMSIHNFLNPFFDNSISNLTALFFHRILPIRSLSPNHSTLLLVFLQLFDPTVVIRLLWLDSLLIHFHCFNSSDPIGLMQSNFFFRLSFPPTDVNRSTFLPNWGFLKHYASSSLGFLPNALLSIRVSLRPDAYPLLDLVSSSLFLIFDLKCWLSYQWLITLALFHFFFVELLS